MFTNSFAYYGEFQFFLHISGTVHVILCRDMSNINLHLAVKWNFWWHLESRQINGFWDSISSPWLRVGSDRFSTGLMEINSLIVKSAQQLSTYREGLIHGDHSQMAISFKLFLQDASLEPFGIKISLKYIHWRFLYQNLVNLSQVVFVLC